MSEEIDWKRYGFGDIINEQIEHENLELRKKLGNFEGRLRDREQIHEAVKSELELATQHISVLHTAHSSAVAWAQGREAHANALKKRFQDLYSKYASLRKRFYSLNPKENDVEEKREDQEAGTRHRTSQVDSHLDKAEADYGGPPVSVAPSFSVGPGAVAMYDEDCANEKQQTSGTLAVVLSSNPFSRQSFCRTRVSGRN